MTRIKELSEGVFMVNDKKVDTRERQYGKNISASEYRALLNYIKAIKGRGEMLSFGKYKGVRIELMTSQEQTRYLYWLKQSKMWGRVQLSVQEKINNHLNGGVKC